MKLYQQIGILIGFFVLFSNIASAHHEKTFTRADFIKLVVSEKFTREEIKTCDRNSIPFQDVHPRSRAASYVCVAYKNDFIRKNTKFRGAASITLAEAAAILQPAFYLQIPEYTPYQNSWHQPYLLALEEQNAIPISFWKPNDIVTKEEAKEIIRRLAQRDTTKPSMTFEALHTQRNRYRAENLLRISGDFIKPIEDKILTTKVLHLLREPGTYYIDDIDAAEQDSANYCHNYYTQSGVRGNATIVTKGNDAAVTIEALSTDYCVFPFPEMQPGECPPDALYSDDPRCNRGKAKPYTLTLEQKGNQLFVKGAENNRIRITRAPIESLCREFADGCPAGYYNYTKVATTGSLNTIPTPNGETWNIYKTKWRPVFGDLRGAPFIFFEKTLPDGSLFQKYYEAPEHNRNAWGHGFASYEDCIADPVGSSMAQGVDFHFCIRRAGNEFIIASPYELGDRLTIWIDTYYRR